MVAIVGGQEDQRDLGACRLSIRANRVFRSSISQQPRSRRSGGRSTKRPRCPNKSGLKRRGRGGLCHGPQCLEGLMPYGQGPGPGVLSKKPDTVPLKVDDVVVPVVLTTTTNVEFAGTTKE